MLVSVPYGFREALTHPRTGKVAFQVLGFASIERGLEVLNRQGFTTKLQVWQAQEQGWSLVKPQTCHAKYADGCPGAKAVALILAHR